MCKIRVGDKVMLRRGKDKNKIGLVGSVRHLGDASYVTVSGLLVCKKTKKDAEGGFLYKERFVNVSHVALVDKETGRPTKVGYRFNAEGKKVRFAKLSGEEI